MKYLTSWTPRPGGSPAEAEAATKRALDVFAKWTPPEGVTMREFLTRLDTGGGYAVVECDDPMLVAEAPAKFAPWFDFEVVPVIDISDSLATAQEAIAFRDSVG